MDNEKGITLAALIVYIIATIMALAVLSSIIANFTSNLSTLSANPSIEQQLGKFDYYFLEDVKRENAEVDEIGISGEYIVFSNAHRYELADGEIVFTDGETTIILMKNVSTCVFSQDIQNSNKIIVEIELDDGTEKTLNYIMEHYTNNVETPGNYTYNYISESKKTTSTVTNSVTALSTVGFNLLDYKIYGNSPAPNNSLGILVTDSSSTYYNKYKIHIKIAYTGTTLHKYIYLNEPLRKVNDTYVDYIDFLNKKVVRKVGYIQSYDGETITTDYVSSSGSLTTGATVIYGLVEQTEEEMNLPVLETANGLDTTYSVEKDNSTDVVPSKITIRYYRSK